jgi:hypothetical protein
MATASYGAPSRPFFVRPGVATHVERACDPWAREERCALSEGENSDQVGKKSAQIDGIKVKVDTSLWGKLVGESRGWQLDVRREDTGRQKGRGFSDGYPDQA